MSTRSVLVLAGAVAASFVSSASASPLVFDRGVLPGDLSVGAASSSQQDHSVARGGDQFLVAWSDSRGQSAGGSTSQSHGDVFGIRLDGDGRPIDPIPFLIAGGMGLQNRPRVAWNGESWLVLYISQDPVAGYFEHRLRGVRVSAAGVVLDSPPIVFPASQFSPDTIGLEVAGQGGRWLVTRCIYHDDGYGTYLAGQRIDGNGQLLDAVPRMIEDWIYGPTVIVAGNGEYLAAGPDWTNSSTFKARRVGLDGLPIGPAFGTPSLEIAGNGTEYYVAWISGWVNLVGSRMSPTGALANPAGTLLVANYSQYHHATLAHDGLQWWLEWGASDDLRTIRIDAAGNVLDPNGGVPLPIVIGGNIDNAYDPRLAARPAGGVIVAWYDSRVALGYDTNVSLLPIDAANVPGSERVVSTGTRNQRAPDLSAGPNDRSALVFVSEAANDDRVLFQPLDASGTPLFAEPLLVASAPTIGRVGIAWNGTAYLVAWDEGESGLTPTQIKARRLDENGAFLDAVPMNVMPGFGPDVEALGEDFLIASARVHTYPQFIHAWMRIVDGPTGAFQNAPTLIGGGYVNVGPRVRQDGSRWVVTYHSHWSHDNSASDAIYNFVSPDGSFTPSLNPATTSGGSGTPDVAFSGQKYLFVWRNNSLANANNFIAGRIMNADGSFATGNFTIAEAPGRQLDPVVVWDGTNFLVAWADGRNQGAFFDERTDVYGARVSETGVVLDPAGFAIDAGPQGDATPSLVARTNGVSFAATARFVVTPEYDSYRIGVATIGLGASTGADATPLAGRDTAISIAPNPFRDRTVIRFSVPRQEDVRLSIHDVGGREIAVLEDRRFEIGTFTSAWDGRDGQGRNVASGAYFVRMVAESGRTTVRTVLVR